VSHQNRTMPDPFDYEPAVYPANNTEEMQAVVTFISLIDLKRVKPDTKFLDKVPNLDGSLELVDEHQRKPRYNFPIVKKLLLAPLALSLPLSCSHAAISVTTTPVTQNFGSRPAATEWSTRSAPTDDTSTWVTLDARVNTNYANTITAQVLNASGNPPGANGSAAWTSGGSRYLQTRPTANGHTLLMATLRNDTIGTASNLNLVYTLTEGGDANPEEVPGHRVYWSLSGNAGGWTPIEAIDGLAGWKTASISLPGWAAGSMMYLLWADDNGDGTTDRGYQIDNLALNVGPAPLFVNLSTPVHSSLAFPPLSIGATTFGHIAATNVSFYTNGVLAAVDTTPPYSAVLPSLAAGTYAIHATAKNGVDPVAYSTTNTVTILTVLHYTGDNLLENFDGMTPVGVATPTGWYVGAGLPITNTVLAVGDGSAPPDATVLGWNYGTTGDPDRALGTAPTGENRYIAVSIQNNTGSNITSVEIHFDGEVWRNYTNVTVTGSLTTEISINGGVDWFPSGLVFTQPLPSSPPVGAVDGNAPANRTADIHGVIILPSALPPGAVLFIRWTDINDASFDGGLSIDNFSFRAGHDIHSRRLDFEFLPDGSAPTDRMMISNQFAGPPFFMRFQYEDGTYPQIAIAGAPRTAFTPGDNPAVWQDVGTHFLTDDGTIRDVPPPLIVTFTTNVAAVSGAILDIDQDQAWRIQTRNVGGVVGTTLNINTNNPGTGSRVATYWSLVRSNADIASLRIVYTGPNAPGFALDNFSTTGLQAPAAAQLSAHVVSDRVSLEFTGTPSAVYSIHEAGALGTNWTPVTTTVLPPSFVLPRSPFTFTNFESTTATQRFYRAIGYP
jgi:hypothetical protein